MCSRWLIGVMAFWVAFPAVAAGGPAYLLAIAPVFVLWAAVAVLLEPRPSDARARGR